MKIVVSSGRCHYAAILSIFLITLVVVSLAAGMVGCGRGVIEYDLTIDSSVGGWVTTPGEGTFVYHEGEVVNLVAEAEEGYRFAHWIGNVGTIADVTAAATAITMDDNYSVTARFASTIEPEYTPMVAAGEYHTVGLKSDGTVVAAIRSAELAGWDLF
jgi:hypothetical protein